MSDSYKHSYKTGENLLNSLSVYNVGYQKCEPEYQWGPGIRDHYCIHHILSGSGVYTMGNVSVRLSAGDTFILFPGTELQYQADKDEPCSVNFVVIRKQFLCFVKVAAGAVHAPIPLTAALQRIEVINAAGVNLSEHTKSPFLSAACPRKRH